MAIRIEDHSVTTHDGWTLALHRGVPAGDLPEPGSRPPVIFVPGYGMNGYIFRYHPSAPSFMESLLASGLDPWSVDLRGSSTATRGARAPRSVRLVDQAFVDLPAALDHVSRVTGFDVVDAIGCSLGGSLLYAYGAGLKQHRIRRLVTMGTPLQWPPSLMTSAAGWLGPTLGQVPMRGTRRMSRVALPIAATLLPAALSTYLNPKITRTRPARLLSLTVENPIPDVNREMARWMRHGDLVLDGLHVTRAMADFRSPLLVIYGSGDRICPRDAALSALTHTGGPSEMLEITHPSGEGVGHADLFISDIAPEAVFPQVARWLLADDRLRGVG